MERSDPQDFLEIFPMLNEIKAILKYTKFFRTQNWEQAVFIRNHIIIMFFTHNAPQQN